MVYDLTPESASHGRVLPDADLPHVAAQWLVQGFDSPLLRELAGLGAGESLEARRMWESVLAELGHPVRRSDFPYEDLPWRGYWEQIWWARDQIGKTHSIYASAQIVLEQLSDVPELWEPGRGAELQGLLERWDVERDHRSQLDEAIRAHLDSLTEGDVPPLADNG